MKMECLMTVLVQIQSMHCLLYLVPSLNTLTYLDASAEIGSLRTGDTRSGFMMRISANWCARKSLSRFTFSGAVGLLAPVIKFLMFLTALSATIFALRPTGPAKP
jgi:hypothetical protein